MATMNNYIKWCVDNAKNRRLQSTSAKFLVDMEIQSINRPYDPNLKWYWLKIGAEGRGPYDYPRFGSDEEELQFLSDRKQEVRAAVTETVLRIFYKATVRERAKETLAVYGYPIDQGVMNRRAVSDRIEAEDREARLVRNMKVFEILKGAERKLSIRGGFEEYLYWCKEAGRNREFEESAQEYVDYVCEKLNRESGMFEKSEISPTYQSSDESEDHGPTMPTAETWPHGYDDGDEINDLTRDRLAEADQHARMVQRIQASAEVGEAEAYAVRLGRRMEREALRELRREHSRERFRLAREARVEAARLAGEYLSSIGSDPH